MKRHATMIRVHRNLLTPNVVERGKAESEQLLFDLCMHISGELRQGDKSMVCIDRRKRHDVIGCCRYMTVGERPKDKKLYRFNNPRQKSGQALFSNTHLSNINADYMQSDETMSVLDSPNSTIDLHNECRLFHKELAVTALRNTGLDLFKEYSPNLVSFYPPRETEESKERRLAHMEECAKNKQKLKERRKKERRRQKEESRARLSGRKHRAFCPLPTDEASRDEMGTQVSMFAIPQESHDGVADSDMPVSKSRAPKRTRERHAILSESDTDSDSSGTPKRKIKTSTTDTSAWVPFNGNPLQAAQLSGPQEDQGKPKRKRSVTESSSQSSTSSKSDNDVPTKKESGRKAPTKHTETPVTPDPKHQTIKKKRVISESESETDELDSDREY